VFSALEVCYENALYKFTFDIDISVERLASCAPIFTKLIRILYYRV